MIDEQTVLLQTQMDCCWSRVQSVLCLGYLHLSSLAVFAASSLPLQQTSESVALCANGDDNLRALQAGMCCLVHKKSKNFPLLVGHCFWQKEKQSLRR